MASSAHLSGQSVSSVGDAITPFAYLSRPSHRGLISRAFPDAHPCRVRLSLLGDRFSADAAFTLRRSVCCLGPPCVHITGVNSSGHVRAHSTGSTCYPIAPPLPEGVFICMDTDTHRYQVRSPAGEKGDGEGTPLSHAFINSFNIYLLSIFHMLNIVSHAGDSAMKKTFRQKSLPVRSVYISLGGERS